MQDFVNFLRGLYNTKDFIPLHEPRFRGNEKKYLNECIDTTFVSSVGKFVTRFEEMTAEYVGSKYAVAAVNGTAALHIALLMSGVKPGDEVITQPLTFVATANAIKHANAISVFVDVDKATMGMSPNALRKWLNENVAIEQDQPMNRSTNKRIAAIVPMHTFGHPCRIDEIVEIANEYHIPVVEDAAESLGSIYKSKHTGTFGKLGVFSYNGNKIITTGGGGMIVTDDEELAKLAILGMIGDMLEKDINKLNNDIINDAEIKRKRGLLIYPSTRPLNRTLEFCSNPYIPGVTGNTKGVTELLREINLNPAGGKYKSLIELDKEEMERLITAIMLRNPKTKHREMIGDIFLLKFFNRLEDARELSAMINACSKLGDTGLAMQLCMEVPKAKKKAEAIHAKYKQFIISGLKFVSETEKIKGNGFVIINAKNNIKDTMVGTIASILSNSSMYDEGTTIITMAHYEDKIKISARNVGRNGRNVREILSKVITLVKGEVGGHRFAAGCTIKQDKEQEFIDTLKKNLEIELVKI